MGPIADNTAQNGTDTIATDDIAALSAKVQRMKVGYGDDGSYTDASATNPLPVTPGVNGGALATTTGAIGAGSTGTVGPLTVGTLGNASFIIRNTTAASAWAGAPVVVFEQSGDSTSWSPLPVARSDTGQVGSTFTLGPGAANAELVFDCALEGISYIRARVTTGPTTNGFTIDIAAGGMPFPQGNTVLAAPLDGYKPTYLMSPSSTDANAHITATTGQPFLVLQNPSASTKTLRVLRVRINLTIGTAATVQMVLCRYTANSTGGTFLSRTCNPIDAADPASAATGGLYSVVPTSNATGLVIIGFRRLWVGLSTAAGGPYVSEWTFGSGKPAKALVLRPGYQVGITWGVAPAASPTMDYEFEWTEEPA